MTSNFQSYSRRRGASVCGLGGLALASVLLLCGAGNLPVENFTPQGPMQADLNAGGHSVTNAAAVDATNVVVSGSLSATNFTLPFASVTGTPATLAGYGIGDTYTKTASDARYSPLAGSTNVITVGAVTAGSFPYANLTGNPVTVAGGKTLAVTNSLTLAGTDGSTLNVGAGGTLGSAAFAATSAFLASSAIGTTVQGYSANTTTLGNAVNGAGDLVQADGSGLLPDAVVRPGAKLIYVSQGKGNDTRTGLSKYSAATPFATLTGAAAAAASGDTIVAEDGTFTDKNIVLVSGVNWFFLPSATVAVTGAVNNDAVFKDNGTAATALLAGCGQTFSMSSTAASATMHLLAVTAASTVTVHGLSFTTTASGTFSTIATVYSNSASAVINFTGNLGASASGTASAYALEIGTAGGGTITITGDALSTSTTSTANAISCDSDSTSSGTVVVSGRAASNNTAIYGASTCAITCGSLLDGGGSSYVYNHLTLLGPVLLVLPEAALATGFNATDTLGPENHLVELEPPATVATGTINLPSDALSRIGERVTVLATQTVTTLTVTVPGSGTLYGYSAGSVGPGSITFEKMASNTWVKL